MAKRARGWGYRTGTRKDAERERNAARDRKKRGKAEFHILTTAERRAERTPPNVLRKPHASSTILD